MIMTTEPFWQLPGYKELKHRLQLQYANLVISAANYACVCCGKRFENGGLDVAHITPTSEFVMVRGRVDDIKYSYTPDNLIALCRRCHDAQESNTSPAKYSERAERDEITGMYGGRMVGIRNDPEINKFFDMVEKLSDEELIDYVAGNRRVISYLLDSTRMDRHKNQLRNSFKFLRLKVVDIFERKIIERGWRYAWEAIAAAEATSHIGHSLPETIQPKNEELRTMPEEWKLVGAKDTAKCHIPSGNDVEAIKRFVLKLCVSGPKGCMGDVFPCENCGITYCLIHSPVHKNGNGQ